MFIIGVHSPVSVRRAVRLPAAGILLAAVFLCSLGGCGAAKKTSAGDSAGDIASGIYESEYHSGKEPGSYGSLSGSGDGSGEEAENSTSDSAAEQSEAAVQPFNPETDDWIARGSFVTGNGAKTENTEDTLSVPTILRRVGDTWFLVDCYHNRILYTEGGTEALKTPVARWSVLPSCGMRQPHTVDGDGTVLLADDTENNRVLVYTESGGTYAASQVFEGVGDRPHFTVYDEQTDTFYVWSSESGQMYCFRHPEGSTEMFLTQILTCTRLEDTYVRSFTILGDRILFVSGLSASGEDPEILVCRLSDLEVLEEYPVCGDYAGMVQILPVEGTYSADEDSERSAEGTDDYASGGYFVTISTDRDGSQKAADMLWVPSLWSLSGEPDSIVSFGVRDIYPEYFIGGGTPYYMSRVGGRYYLTEHRLPGHSLWSFSVENGEITDVQSIY